MTADIETIGTRPDDDAFLRRLEAVPREMARLHGLPDRWLGEAVLKLARDVRERGDVARTAEPGNARLLWVLVPEVARRLGCRLGAGEGGCADMDEAGLRGEVGRSMRAFSPLALVPARGDGEPCPVDLLSNGIGNGSPVAVALDRAAPPGIDAEDHCAMVVKGTCVRRGHRLRPAWDPGMQVIAFAPRNDAQESMR